MCWTKTETWQAPHPKFSLNFETDDATHAKESWQFIIHIMSLSWERSVGLTQIKKKKKKGFTECRKLSWFFCEKEVGVMQVPTHGLGPDWFELLAPRERSTWPFLTACPNVGQKIKRSIGTWKLTAAKHKKWSQILYYKVEVNCIWEEFPSKEKGWEYVIARKLCV